jgi:hypothetical protein
MNRTGYNSGRREVKYQQAKHIRFGSCSPLARPLGDIDLPAARLAAAPVTPGVFNTGAPEVAFDPAPRRSERLVRALIRGSMLTAPVVSSGATGGLPMRSWLIATALQRTGQKVRHIREQL